MNNVREIQQFRKKLEELLKIFVKHEDDAHFDPEDDMSVEEAKKIFNEEISKIVPKRYTKSQKNCFAKMSKIEEIAFGILASKKAL